MTHTPNTPPAAPRDSASPQQSRPTKTPPRIPRPNAEYRWTRPKLAAFLKALVDCGTVAGAARSVGMSRQSAYRLRARLGPGPFADLWDDALRLGIEGRIMRADARLARPSIEGHASVQGDVGHAR